MDREEAVLQIRGLIGEAALVLQLEGFDVPPELKRRDPREPGRRRKQAAEDRLISKLLRYWRGQKTRIQDKLTMFYPARKAIGDAEWPQAAFDDAYWNAESEALAAELFGELAQAGKDGVRLFGEQVPIGLDYSAVDPIVVEKARTYTYELVGGINDTTRAALQAAISAFAETSGMTIGDVMDLLPYDEQRAAQIATTEITRAYAAAAQDAGEALAEQFPGVSVTHSWFTNEDDRVCPICAPLDGQELAIDEAFTGGDGQSYDMPPAHPGCRCWSESGTNIE